MLPTNSKLTGSLALILVTVGLRVSGSVLPVYLSNIDSMRDKVYYAPDRKLYNVSDIGSQGPCKLNMMLVRVKDSPNEVTCVCKSSRHLFMLPFNTGCYEIYKMGPCQAKEWVQMIDGMGKCVANPCSNQSKKVSGITLVDYNGTCVPVNSPCDEGGFQVQVSKGDEGYTTVCNPPMEDCFDIAPEFMSAPKCPLGKAVAADGICYSIGQVPLDPMKRGKLRKAGRTVSHASKLSSRNQYSTATGSK